VKGRFLLVLAIMLALISAGCSTKSSSAKTDSGDWLKEAKLDQTETVDELYEQAKKEGKVVVYSQSSRIKDVKASFEKQYPGIKVEAHDISSNEMVEKIVREQDAGLHNVDVVFIKDTSGIVSKELLKEGRLHKYAPDDITKNIHEQFKDHPGLPFYFSADTVFFNTEKYKEAPVTNWWDLTDPEWKSKVVMPDPLVSAGTLDLLATMVQNSDEMAEAYKEKYGEEIKLNGTENAGYEFIKRLLDNDPIFSKSSGDVTTSIGTPGQDDPPIGIAGSSKARNIEDEGLKMAYTYDLKPRMSIPGTSYLYVADKADNTAAAKLLIRWMAGEADGKAEGFSPYNVLGSWSTRTDVEQHPEQRPMEELNLWKYDPEYLYQHVQEIKDFIMTNQ